MTVLSSLQSAAVRLAGRRPSAFFSSSEQMEMEMADLATATAVAIAKAYDWQALTRLGTLTGDGVTTSFPLPDDYSRLRKKGDIHSTRWSLSRFTPARDLDQWLDFQSSMPVGAPGAWIILGDRLQVYPAMPVGESARFYYQSKIITTVGDKAAFDSDGDVYNLNEDLLTLGVIWRWRAQKRLEYAEDLVNYETAMSALIGPDKGPRILTGSGRRMSDDVRIAYPGTLG